MNFFSYIINGVGMVTGIQRGITMEVLRARSGTKHSLANANANANLNTNMNANTVQ